MQKSSWACVLIGLVLTAVVACQPMSDDEQDLITAESVPLANDTPVVASHFAHSYQTTSHQRPPTSTNARPHNACLCWLAANWEPGDRSTASCPTHLDKSFWSGGYGRNRQRAWHHRHASGQFRTHRQ